MSTSHKPSSSSFQQPSSSSGSSESQLSIDPGIGLHKWFRLLCVAFIIYLVLLPVWWYCLGAVTYVAGVCADVIYHFFDSTVSITPDGRIINVSIAGAQGILEGEARRSALNMTTITYGLPMLAALVLATRSNSIRLKARALIIGVTIMTAITVPAVLLWAKIASLELDEQISGAAGRGGSASYFYYVFHGYAFSQPVLAVAIWIGLIMLGALNQEKEQAADSQAVKTPSAARMTKPKSPCPCGSGKRYKNCCGRRSIRPRQEPIR